MNLPWVHPSSRTKFGPYRFTSFEVYWIKPDKKTDRHAKYIYICLQIKLKINIATKHPRTLVVYCKTLKSQRLILNKMRNNKIDNIEIMNIFTAIK